MSSHSIFRAKPRKRIQDLERWFIDIETWRLNAQNFAFCVIKNWNGDVQRVFYTPQEARDFLHSRPSNVLVFAHNCWKFDGLAFYDVQELLHADRLVAGNRIISMTIQREDGYSIEWRDSVAMFQLPISKLGDALGLPKGETPIDFIKGNARTITPLDIEYCTRDVEILRVAIRKMDDLFNEWCNLPPGTAELPSTAASLAYRVWCTRYWPEKWSSFTTRRSRGKATFGEVLLDEQGNPKRNRIDRGFCDFRANDTVRQAYYGGRTQVLCEAGTIQNWVHSVDGNAWYQSVMKGHDYPNIATCRLTSPTMRNLHAILPDPLRVCWANIRLEAGPDSPLFLPNTSPEGKRQWDSPLFDGWLCEPEIRYALENGYTVTNITELWYASSMRPFDEFVDFFYSLRRYYQDKDDPRELFVKLLMSACYGRFGMKDFKDRIDQPEKVASIIESEEDWIDKYRMDFYNGPKGAIPYFEDLEPSRKATSTWFGFAAFVTSYSRVELQKVIQTAGTAACYVDTDSVAFTAEGYDRVMESISIGTELGSWKFETPPDGIPFAIYWEPKAYVHFDEEMTRLKVRHKGVSIYDDEGNLKPEAGDLTKEQSYVTCVQFYTALRRNLPLGTELLMNKRSKRWYRGEET